MSNITATFEVKECNQNGEFSGYASVFHVIDHQGDKILPGAFQKHLIGKNFPKMLWQHDVSAPIGLWQEVREDEHGLFVKGKLLLDVQKGREAYALMQAGVLDGLSIGFRVVQSARSKECHGRILKEIDLHEISLVTFAANPEARVLDIKSKEEGGEMDLNLTEKGLTMTDLETIENRLNKMEAVFKRPLQGGEVALKDETFLSYVRKGIGQEALEQKALTTQTDQSGGYLVPHVISDVIYRQLGDLSVMRHLASVTNISTDALDLLLERGEANVGWVAETAQRDETDTPELTRVRIPVHEIYAKPRVSQKLLDDAFINVENWLATCVATKMAAVENAAFLYGDGEGKPRGFLTYPTCEIGHGEWGRFETIQAGQELASADAILDIFHALKAPYLPGACWLMSRSVAARVRKIKDGAGHYLWQPALANQTADTLLGHPVVLCDDIADALVFGNFKKAYQIVDRQHLYTLRDPYSAKPYVEFYTTKRVGGDVVDFDALKVIRFA